jgi:hypothetical protein
MELNGILTTRNRPNFFERWLCGICKTANTGGRTLCCACLRPRIPSWLKLGAQPIDLGVIVRIKAARRLPIFDPMADAPPQAQIGIVTKIDVMRRTILVHKLVSNGEAVEGVDFEEADFDQIEVEQNSESAAPFLNFGWCGECHEVYRILNGTSFGTEDSRTEVRRQRLKKLSGELSKQFELKEQWKKVRKHDAVLECSAAIKIVQNSIVDLKKEMERLQTWCPFCGWCG